MASPNFYSVFVEHFDRGDETPSTSALRERTSDDEGTDRGQDCNHHSHEGPRITTRSFAESFELSCRVAQVSVWFLTLLKYRTPTSHQVCVR